MSRIVYKVLLLVFSMALVLNIFAGCSNSSKDPASEGKTQTSEAATKAASTAEATAPVDPYAEFLEFTVFSLDDSPDFQEFPMVKAAQEKFNCKINIQQVAWDSWGETTRTLAATKSLPEVIAWYDLNYNEYLKWVDQGIFKAMPDLADYPNLKKITEDYSIFEKLKVGGKLYAFPKIITSNPWNQYSNEMFIYRRDWAKAMGHDYKPVQVLTYPEFITYLEEVKAKDPGKLGDKLVPLDLTHGGGSWKDFISFQFNSRLLGYKKADGKYQWGADDPSSLKGILELNKLYNKGLLAKDSYADGMSAGTERFQAGMSAVYYSAYVPAGLDELFSKVEEGKLKSEDFGIFCIKQDDGFHAGQKLEWWGAGAFSAECRGQVMERWLALGNWMLEDEQIKEYAFGVKDVDWNEANGKITVNWTSDDIQAGKPKYYIAIQKFFQKFFILEGIDTWVEGNPLVNSYTVNDLYKSMMTTIDTAPSFTPTDYDLTYFTGKKYSESSLGGEINDAVIKSVVAKDPTTEWNKFIEAKRATAKEILDEINTEFGK